MKYPDAAVDRAKDGALDWLRDNPDGGYPRSWQQEKLHDDRRGYVMYDDWEAPPIAGYEALEREGVVVRVGVVVKSDGEERVHFRLSHPVNPPRIRVDGEDEMGDKDLVDLLDEVYHTYGPMGSPRDETKLPPPVTCIVVERTPVEVFAALTSDQVDHWDFEDRHLMHRVAKAIVKARSAANPG